MKRFARAALLAATCAVLSGTSFAQGACPAGRTGHGQCANAEFTTGMTRGAVITSQPKLSTTHYPVLPAIDWVFRYPNQLNPDPARPAATNSSVSTTP